jgi:hypothetical protein
MEILDFSSGPIIQFLKDIEREKTYMWV